MSEKPVIGITMGDPAGVGPEIAVKVFTHTRIYELCKPLLIGDAGIFSKACNLVDDSLTINTISEVRAARFQPGQIDVLDLSLMGTNQLQPGVISAVAGKAAFKSIKKGIELALSGAVDALVTNPIHKESLNLAGFNFAGHTEILAHYTGSSDVAMLLVHGALRIAHVSTHVSLRKACDLVKKERVLKVIHLLHEACQMFGIAHPEIGVAGLNPHASDGGLFGTEEAEEIIPAIETAKAQGYHVEGPVPPDTFYARAKAGFYDGCVAMYHDQGHIPFKMETFRWDKQTGRIVEMKGVNVTLGIPIIRTSVDHGTAFDIAWRGVASADPLMEAITVATQMAEYKTSKTSNSSV